MVVLGFLCATSVTLWCVFARNSSTTESQRTQRLHREERDRTFLCKVLLIVLVFPAVAVAQTPKRIVVVYWYDKDYPWNTMFDQGFRTALNSAAAQHAEYH